MNLIEVLKLKGGKITTAESCTGGLVAAKIVSYSGASAFYEEGFITYSNEAKVKHLGIPMEDIDLFGVVSEEIASKMALGAAKNAGTEYAIATTGVAGPTGGTSECPVGTVCFGFVVREKIFSERKVFDGDRDTIRQKACDFAIDTMISLLMEG